MIGKMVAVAVPSLQVNLESLMLWTVVTVLFIALLSFIFYTTSAASRRQRRGVQPPAAPAPSTYISVNVDDALSGVRRAGERLEEGKYAEALELAAQASAQVLYQLMRYFSIDTSLLNLADCAHILQSRGVKLRFVEAASRLNAVRVRGLTGPSLTRAEAQAAIAAAQAIVQGCKETPVDIGRKEEKGEGQPA